jgi:hypothetical protein
MLCCGCRQKYVDAILACAAHVSSGQQQSMHHIFYIHACAGYTACRQMYANARLACAAHKEEMMEATALSRCVCMTLIPTMFLYPLLHPCRQMYANARLACAAHEKEMMEATARIQAQRELAAAQAQAAQRALTVAREKAAHEVCGHAS